MTPTDEPKEHIFWIDVLRGLNIILVLMWHVNIIDINTGTNHIECLQVAHFFQPIRMPLFMFISGGVLYLGRIKPDWGSVKFYKDKAIRLFIPFLFFSFVVSLWEPIVHLLSNSLDETTLPNILNSLFRCKGLAIHLWFLPVLFCFMLLFPFYKIACKNNFALLFILIIALALNLLNASLFPMTSQLTITVNPLFVDKAAKYFVFFVLGIIYFRFKAHFVMKNWRNLLLSTIIFFISFVYLRSFPLWMSMCGILLMITLAMQLCKLSSSLFKSFRGYSFPIYLMSMPIQYLFGILLWKSPFYEEHLYWLFYVLSILIGLYLPVLIAKNIELSKYGFLKTCFGLKQNSIQ